MNAVSQNLFSRSSFVSGCDLAFLKSRKNKWMKIDYYVKMSHPAGIGSGLNE